jgi:hypothetical protein
LPRGALAADPGGDAGGGAGNGAGGQAAQHGGQVGQRRQRGDDRLGGAGDVGAPLDFHHVELEAGEVAVGDAGEQRTTGAGGALEEVGGGEEGVGEVEGAVLDWLGDLVVGVGEVAAGGAGAGPVERLGFGGAVADPVEGVEAAGGGDQGAGFFVGGGGGPRQRAEHRGRDGVGGCDGEVAVRRCRSNGCGDRSRHGGTPLPSFPATGLGRGVVCGCGSAGSAGLGLAWCAWVCRG